MLKYKELHCSWNEFAQQSPVTWHIDFWTGIIDGMNLKLIHDNNWRSQRWIAGTDFTIFLVSEHGLLNANEYMQNICQKLVPAILTWSFRFIIIECENLVDALKTVTWFNFIYCLRKSPLVTLKSTMGDSEEIHWIAAPRLKISLISFVLQHTNALYTFWYASTVYGATKFKHFQNLYGQCWDCTWPV